MKFEGERILFAPDMAGTLLFAVEGASAAIGENLDLLGLMVLAFATALGGGIVRDVVIGAVPPAALRDWRYAAVAFSGGTMVFFLHFPTRNSDKSRHVPGRSRPLTVCDCGHRKGLAAQDAPLHCRFIRHGHRGRRRHHPRPVSRAHSPSSGSGLYVTAALAGSLVTILALKLKLSPAVAAFCGGAICFLLLVVSVWKHWNLPKVSGN